jgi:hypothetical protein
MTRMTDRLLRSFGWMTLIVVLGSIAVRAALPTAEFDIPYQLRILSDGSVLEISGSFSWALPQNFQAALAAAPQVRVVRLESPGGHLKPALEVAAMIRERGFDTYVGRLCASACTIAFLSGRQRWLGPKAQLGFHQAIAPGVSQERASMYLRDAYERLGVPAAFIAHVLHTPPSGLWIPTHDVLLAAKLATNASATVPTTFDDRGLRTLREAAQLSQVASDDSVVQFAADLSELLRQLQDIDPETCWVLTHDGPVELYGLVSQARLDAISADETRLAEEASDAPRAALNGGERKSVFDYLVQYMQGRGKIALLDGLRPEAAHAAFCPSLTALLQTALELPAMQRARAIRAVLPDG